MTSSARAIVDRMFEAFNAKDLDAALSTVSHDTIWIHHGSQKLPAVRFSGKSGAAKFFQTSFTAMKIDYFRPVLFIEQGDKVVVLGEESYVMDGIEEKLTNKWVQVYSVQDGLISRMEEFATSAAHSEYMLVS